MKKLILVLPLVLIAAACNSNPSNNGTDYSQSSNSGTKTYTIADYTFEYPSGWETKTCTNQHDVDSAPFTTPDCALLSPTQVATGPIVGTQKIQGKLDEVIANDGYFKNGITREEKIIDGHKTVYIKTNSPQYSYIDNTYYIEDGNSVVRFGFREYEVSHPEGSSELTTDNRQYLPDFQNIVNSVKFH